MSVARKTGLRTGAAGVVIPLALGLAGIAIASGVAPVLLSPNKESVSAGAIRLVVGIPLTPNEYGVFIAIQPNRKTKYGHLTGSCTTACDFVEPTHWRGHKYSYLAHFHFPGYWAVTPGKYYWQAHYYTKGDIAVFYSGIGSFTVR